MRLTVIAAPWGALTALTLLLSIGLPAQNALAGLRLTPDARHTSHATRPAPGARARPDGRSRPSQIPLRTFDPERLRREKEDAARGVTPGGADRFGPLPGTPSRAGARVSMVPGLNQAGLGPTDTSPPDTTGAVGPSHYVEIVNTSIAVYDKANLTQIGSSLSLREFIQRSTVNERAFDPQIMWDPQTSRWYYVMVRLEGPSGSQTGHLAFGWSKTADPTDLTSGWCHQDISTSDEVDDFPKLGDNDSHLVIGANVFPTNGGNFFRTARVLTVPKPSAGVATCPESVSGIQSFGSLGTRLRTADGAIAFTPVPANTVDSAAAGYVVAEDTNGGRNDVAAWHVDPSGYRADDER